mmetsp:Transcript_12308/g.26091  ORF Transcript_12308/g.26091 Transcript_12308/m.26091 type:complete len:298 (-) Transcript_12308:18-911(-)
MMLPSHRQSTELSASFNTTTRANTRRGHTRIRENRNLTTANIRLMQGNSNSSVSDTNATATKLIRFGHSVEIGLDLIVVGAIDDGDNSEGRVYVYRRVDDEWIRDGRLGNLASGSRSEDFGSSVSLNGIVIVVGDDRYGDTDQGAFYVFHFEGLSWLQMQSAFVSTVCDGRFASHVELLDQYQLFVSCSEENISSGALYYYTRSSLWTQSNNVFTRKQTLVASDLRASEQFGVHSSSRGTTSVIGTWQSENGRVMAFALENGAWAEKTVIDAPTGFEQGFGHKVAFDGNTILIASYG